MDRERILARAIVEEFRPIIQQEIANGMLQFHQRLASVEADVKILKSGRSVSAEDTGAHSISDLQLQLDRAKSKLQRRIDMERMEDVAAKAVAKVEQQSIGAWFARNGWKLIAAAVAIWNALVTYWRIKK